MNKLIYMVTEDDAFETGTDSAGVDYEYIFVKTATGIKEIRVYNTVANLGVEFISEWGKEIFKRFARPSIESLHWSQWNYQKIGNPYSTVVEWNRS